MKIRLPLIALTTMLAAVPGIARAHCPLCTAATGSLVLVSRFYGVDDFVVSTFIGAFIVSTAFWFNRMLKKRNGGKDYIAYQPLVFVLLSLALTIWGFQTGGLVSLSRAFGFDKIVFGMITGTVATLAAYKVNGVLRSIHGGRHFMPFQVIVLTVAMLFATVGVYYLAGVAS